MLSSPPPPTPDQLRSIQHVCKCKECYHPPPPPTRDQLRSIQHVCKCKECYHPPPHPPLTSCVASNMCAKWGETSKCAQKPTAFCEPWANYLRPSWGPILQVVKHWENLHLHKGRVVSNWWLATKMATGCQQKTANLPREKVTKNNNRVPKSSSCCTDEQPGLSKEKNTMHARWAQKKVLNGNNSLSFFSNSYK